MTKDIAVINVGALVGQDAAGRAGVARAIGAACRGTGFFAITGHGIGAPVLAAAFDCARRLFAMPNEDKRTLAIGRHGHNRGYVGLGVERLDEAAAPDHKEAYNLIWNSVGTVPARAPNLWPELPDWREPVQAYFDAALALGRRLHQAFALDLGLDELFFADKLDQPMATLRLLRYPAAHPSGSGEPTPLPGAGTHTDYGNVTLLATDGVAGLQVRRRDGGWIDVPPLAGALVCNIGDCLMRWTQDIYVSTPHRVLPPPSERYSIAFFLDPNPEALVGALPGCVPTGGTPRYPPITAADYLQQRLAATYGRPATGPRATP